MAQDNLTTIPPQYPTKREIARAKKRRFADALAKELDKVDVESGDRRWQAVARKVVDAACDGDMEAVRTIALYTDGKPVPSEEELQASGIQVVVLNSALRPRVGVSPPSPHRLPAAPEPPAKISEFTTLPEIDFTRQPPAVERDVQSPERDHVLDAEVVDASEPGDEDYR